MGLNKNTVVVMMHSGSRGLGHQICSDATADCELQMHQQARPASPTRGVSANGNAHRLLRG